MKLGAIATASILAALGACSSLRDEVRSENRAAFEKAETSFGEASSPARIASATPFRIEDGSYIALRASRTPAYRRLPDSFEREGVTLAAATPLDLAGIASLLTRVTGMPVSVDAPPGDGQRRASVAALASNDDAARISQALSGVAPRALAAGGAQPVYAVPESLSDRARMLVKFHGPLSRFLQLVEAQFNVGWRYENGRLHFARSVTRTFAIAALPSVVESQADLKIGLSSKTESSSSGGGGGGGGSGESMSGAQQSASVRVAFDLWKDLDATMKTMLQGQGVYTLSRGLSSLTVTAPPRLMETVSDYIATINQQLERQVTVNVAVYNVVLDETSQRAFSLNGLFRGGRFLGTIGQGAASLANQDTLSAGIVDGSHGGVSGLLKLLDEAGQVSLVTNAAVTTMSGQPVPLQVSNARGYVSKIGTIATLNAVQRDYNTSTVTTGFALNVLPRVLNSGEILLQYGVNVSALVGKTDGFDEIKLGEGEPVLTLPNVDQRSFIQESLLRNGATLVMAGFQQVNDTAAEVGKGSAAFKGLGGSSEAKRKRHLMVICITPRVHRRDATPTPTPTRTDI